MALSEAAAVGVALGSTIALGLIILIVRAIVARHHRRVQQQHDLVAEKMLKTIHFEDTEQDREAREMFDRWMSELTIDPSAKIQRLRDEFRDAVDIYIRDHLELWRYCTYTKDPIDLAPFIAAAGDVGDWELLNDRSNKYRLSEVLCQLICRVLGERIRPDGDPKTTLLPPDLLSLYQRYAKIPSCELRGNASTTKYSDHIPIMMRHYWRSLAGNFAAAQVLRRKDGELSPPYLADDDPRFANIAATEELLQTLLAPFDYRHWPGEDLSRRNHKGTRSVEGHEQFLSMMFHLFDLGLAMFSSPRPMNIFWPDNRQGHEQLQCFGISCTNIVPGSYHHWSHRDVVHSRVFLRPYDSVYQKWRDEEVMSGMPSSVQESYAEFQRLRGNHWPSRILAAQAKARNKARKRTLAAQAHASRADNEQVEAARAEAERVEAERAPKPVDWELFERNERVEAMREEGRRTAPERVGAMDAEAKPEGAEAESAEAERAEAEGARAV
ncbi:hypothetical protein MAPG_02075 [Magnaporthiopsis poae ATCC 64411]|uniref:Uncharacterized protein n=1 Tax=Magnaporthiopsis poae (strain ATCC 64411 / 73-15) TaxID=644358 RepID=A0A0C4DQD6_MAGP6|nr:hypothetical protein MAPG_02075 [Magnaporthiopsis poae ATCC 64411]